MAVSRTARPGSWSSRRRGDLTSPSPATPTRRSPEPPTTSPSPRSIRSTTPPPATPATWPSQHRRPRRLPRQLHVRRRRQRRPSLQRDVQNGRNQDQSHGRGASTVTGTQTRISVPAGGRPSSSPVSRRRSPGSPYVHRDRQGCVQQRVHRLHRDGDVRLSTIPGRFPATYTFTAADAERTPSTGPSRRPAPGISRPPTEGSRTARPGSPSTRLRRQT